MPAAPNCPDCRTALTPGFIPDTTYGRVIQSHWHEGDPQHSSFLGIDTGHKVDPERMLPVWAWRCPECGLLRFYASRD